MIKMNEIDKIYFELCYKLISEGTPVAGTLELNNVQVTLNDITQNIVSIRGISPAYLIGEWLWYFTGRNEVDFIGSYGSLWKKLTDDGKTSNSAYGYIMKSKFGFDQVEKIIELLKKDPNSRRAVININIPNERVIETKDEPCTIALQFTIRDGKLNCTTIMRSNDIWFGFPYDVAFFTEVQMYIANRLGVHYGPYTHFATSLHVYERNVIDLAKIVANPVSKPITFNRFDFRAYKDFVAAKIASEIEAGRTDIPELTLKLAKEYFELEVTE